LYCLTRALLGYGNGLERAGNRRITAAFAFDGEVASRMEGSCLVVLGALFLSPPPPPSSILVVC
jgi:hypothetical protein